MNYVKTALLLGAMTGIILAFGALLGGKTGMTIALVFAAALNFGSYWFSDKIVLRMYRAQPVGRDQAPELHDIVDNLVARAGLPKPKLYVLPQEAPNAFATGRNPQNSAVAVTAGLMRTMNREELEGVVAHELAHVKNRDVLISTIAATIAGAVSYLATMAQWSAIFGGFRGDGERGGNIVGVLAMAILAPIAALLVQMSISRTREYAADAGGAAMTGNPHGLASALAKLGQYSKRVPMRADPSTAHMFIVQPFTGSSLTKLFSTHPPVEERIRRLTGGR